MLPMEERYYKIIRTVLKLLGLWPYQTSRWTGIQTTIITVLYFSGIFVQLAVFVTHKCTLDLTINVFSFIFPSIFMLIMYDIYYFKSDVMKEYMERIRYDWKTLKDKAELSIMHDYANILKQFAEFFSYVVSMGVIISIIFLSIPIILDVVLPLNQSRVHLHFAVEYFVDPSKYTYLFVVHLVFFVFFGAVTLLGTGLAYFSYGLHACAMFSVANYRMAIIIDKRMLQISGPVKEHIIYERLVYAVNSHRKAIEYCNFLLFTFGKPFFFIAGIGVTSLSINLFRLLKNLMTFTELLEMFIPIVLVCGHFCFLFFANHVGQQITNNNSEIFNTVYNLPWHVAPLNIQKLLLFLLQKGSKNIYLTVGGILDASYESFAMLTKLSVSYFTIIRAIQ